MDFLHKRAKWKNVYRGSMLDAIRRVLYCLNLAIMALTPDAVQVFLGVLENC
jgi:hypothetical protein